MTKDVAIIIFAKAPMPGYVKTRLASAIGKDAAARLAARMLDEAVKKAVLADIGPVELCCDPDELHPAFIDARDRYGLRLSQQHDGSLGKRMCQSLNGALNCHARAILIGTDAPQLDVAHIHAARDALRICDAVFIPAVDGGYVLVGISRPLPEIFNGVDWGTERVNAANAEIVYFPSGHPGENYLCLTT